MQGASSADTQCAAAPRYRVLNAEPVEDAAVDPERVALLQERLLQLKGVMSIEKFFSGCVQAPAWLCCGRRFRT